jgi:hypothetical protein
LHLIVVAARFGDLWDVFTEDAHIDYSALGGPAGGLDTATGRVMCFNPQEISMPDGKTHIFMCGLWYVDEYTRTDAGWRISRRVEEKSYVFNMP